MLATERIIEEAMSLPVESRARIVESLLRSLNAPNAENEREWTELAESRLDDLRSGRRETVPLADVVARVRDRLER